MKIKLNTIIQPDYTQARLGNDRKTIDDYKESMQDGDKFPPILVMQATDSDTEGYYIIDGHHRYEAARALGWVTIDANVYMHNGTKEDALYVATGVNKTNGLRMTNADKRRAVRIALTLHPELSDREIASHCGATHPTVSKIRKELNGQDIETPKQAKELPESKTVYLEFDDSKKDDSKTDSKVVKFTTQEDSDEDYDDSDSYDEDDYEDTDSDSDDTDDTNDSDEPVNDSDVLTLYRTEKLGDIAQKIIEFYKGREFALTFISATITDYLKEQNA